MPQDAVRYLVTEYRGDPVVVQRNFKQGGDVARCRKVSVDAADFGLYEIVYLSHAAALPAVRARRAERCIQAQHALVKPIGG
jgi:hypothetical protein